MPISNSATMNRAKVKRGNAMKKKEVIDRKENNDSDSGHHNSPHGFLSRIWDWWIRHCFQHRRWYGRHLMDIAVNGYKGFTFAQHIGASMYRLLVSFLLAAVVAVPLGLLSGQQQ